MNLTRHYFMTRVLLAYTQGDPAPPNNHVILWDFACLAAHASTDTQDWATNVRHATSSTQQPLSPATLTLLRRFLAAFVPLRKRLNPLPYSPQELSEREQRHKYCCDEHVMLAWIVDLLRCQRTSAEKALFPFFVRFLPWELHELLFENKASGLKSIAPWLSKLGNAPPLTHSWRLHQFEKGAHPGLLLSRNGA